MSAHIWELFFIPTTHLQCQILLLHNEELNLGQDRPLSCHAFPEDISQTSSLLLEEWKRGQLRGDNEHHCLSVCVCMHDWHYLLKYTVLLMTQHKISSHWQQKFIMNFSNYCIIQSITMRHMARCIQMQTSEKKWMQQQQLLLLQQKLQFPDIDHVIFYFICTNASLRWCEISVWGTCRESS